MPNNKLSVRVRMYRQGLGDCFLLTFMREGSEDYNLLIDCGIFYKTKNEKKIMQKVAADIKATTGDRLNAVAMTHDHYDHISGFEHGKEIFNQMTFDEVWVGWTENPQHPKFQAVRDRFRNILKGLRAALNLDEMQSEKMKDIKKTVSALVNDFFGADANGNLLGANGDGESDAWNYVLKQKNATPRYCSPGTVFKPNGIEGVRIYVLGPPEDFETFIKEEPPEHQKKDETYRPAFGLALANSFLAAATGNDDEIFDTETYQPFEETYRIGKDKAIQHENSDFFDKHYGFEEADENEWRRIDDDWLRMMGELALWMDDFTNNTCLALAIELIESGKVLIFPGDAQFANWISWQPLSWEIPTENGGTRTIKTEELLARTTFYKVGHHGSHNATLKKHGLEMMNISDQVSEFVAMIPTNRKFAENKRPPQTGWKMPEPELLDRLEEKTRGRVIIADEANKIDLKQRCQGHLSASELENFLEKVNFGGSFGELSNEPLYVEFAIND